MAVSIFNRLKWPIIARILKKNILTNDFYDKLEKKPQAGTICEDTQVMHNGLLIYKQSYCDGKLSKIFEKTKGIFEPEVQYYFETVLKNMGKTPVMIELGSYWGFYSMWFLKHCDGGRAFLIDPNAKNLVFGQRNFSLNNLTGNFICAFIGKLPCLEFNDVPTINIDSFIRDNRLHSVDILHVDIQGYEMEMLEGAAESFQEKKIGYIFIATHSKELHKGCLDFLQKMNYKIVSNIDKPKVKCEDGFILGERITGFKDV